MMKLTVVTGWNPDGWFQYGKMFLAGFQRWWDPSVELWIYNEGQHEIPPSQHHIRQINLMHDVPHARECVHGLYATPEYSGRVPRKGWKPREIDKGYSFRFDAQKFCRQGLIMAHAARELDARGGSQLLLWLDGDVETNRQVPPRFIPSLLPHGADLAYLGREPKHSEIGFQLYRLPNALRMAERFGELYSTGQILQHREWHSAFAFDIARMETGVRAYNVTPGGSGNVWETSPLRSYMVHNKGDRKIDAQRRFYAGAVK